MNKYEHIKDLNIAEYNDKILNVKQLALNYIDGCDEAGSIDEEMKEDLELIKSFEIKDNYEDSDIDKLLKVLEYFEYEMEMWIDYYDAIDTYGDLIWLKNKINNAY